MASVADFTMTSPGFTLAQYIAERRKAAREMVRDAKLKADQIEHEMALLETQTKEAPVNRGHPLQVTTITHPTAMTGYVNHPVGVDRPEFQQGLNRVLP
jgi:hypothetical protein